VRKSLWVFFCRLVGLFLYILHIYLRVLFTFFNEVFLIYKKKKEKKKEKIFSWNTVSWGSSRSEAPDTLVIKKKKKKRLYGFFLLLC